jgi:hypothetical protein
MAKLFTFTAFVAGGLMLADVLIHPSGTQAASAGVASIEKPAVNGLLGVSS